VGLTGRGDERSSAAGWPFGYCWPLDVSTGTYLLIEAARPGPAARTGPRLLHPPVVKIAQLALGQEWDTGVVLRADEAGRLLMALGGTARADARGWIFDPSGG